ncbi:MAG: mechanosensitive ion channel family protein [Halomonadaceae bacterium]|nr:MAG: mechanosensitive ion channel family protein [Halomonadaceae bacterium]
MEILIQWLKPLVVMAVGLTVAITASRVVQRYSAERLSQHRAVLLRRLVFYTITAIFLLMALRQSGFQIGVLLGAAGILTVAIGFASQTSASNIISGLFLLAEKPFELGQMIEVDGNRGVVVGIDLLSVKLRTPENLFVRIPNETLIKTRVVNLNRFPLRRVDLPVGVAYGEDLDKVKRILIELVNADQRCMEEPVPFVLMQQFGASSVDLMLYFWVRQEDFRQLRSDMLFAIKAAFDREGVEIPFPHTSLYAGAHSSPIRISLVDEANTQASQFQEPPL